MANFSTIMGVGGALPEQVVTNEALSKTIDTSDVWIRERTGIQQRHIVSGDETTMTLACQAVLQALDSAHLSPDAVDGVIVATMTPAQMMPSTACLVQQALSLKPGLAFDVNAACSGFIYALTVADALVRQGLAETIAVVGADTMSKVVDWQDRKTCVLFGDGAGAVIVQKSEQPGIVGSVIKADGQHVDLLNVLGGLHTPLASGAYLAMAGRDVFKHAVRALERLVTDSLALAGLTKSDIDWLIPHQANIRIIQSTAKLLRLPPEKVVVTIDKHANTSAASIPLALREAWQQGQIQQGDTALLEAFGAGFTWGACVVHF